MGFLAGKRFLITGVLSNRSIAYGIARACHREGAELAFSYQGERFKERVGEFAAEFGSTLVFDCDVADDAQIERAVRRPRRGLAELRRLRPLDRLRAPGGDRRRLPRGPVARGVPDRPRHLELQLPGDGQGGRAAPAAGRGAAHADLPGGAAQRSQLQHDGPRQGLARGQRALPGGQPRPQGHPRQRHFGRADQDARRLGHQGLRQDPRRRRRRTRRCAATSRSTTSATSPRSCCPTWPPASPRRSSTSTAASATRCRAAALEARRPLERAAAPARAASRAGTQSTKYLPPSTPTPCSSTIDIRPWTSVSKPGNAALKARVKRR